MNSSKCGVSIFFSCFEPGLEKMFDIKVQTINLQITKLNIYYNPYSIDLPINYS
jgi:hypothetical protein